MSIGFGLLKTVLNQGPDAFMLLSNRGITLDSFQGDERTIFSTIEQFYLSYGILPTSETVDASSGIATPWDNFPIEPIDFWIDQIRERTLLLQAGNFVSQAQNAIGHRNLDQLRNYIQQAYISLEESINDHSVQSIIDASREAVLEHNQIQQGTELSGVPFAFPYFNSVSGGMKGGDLIALAGRPGQGKSYLLLNEAIHAHNRGRKVLFVSMEMAIKQCSRRILSLRTGMNYTRFRTGRLSAFGVNRLETDINTMATQSPFQLLSGGVFGTIDRIYAQIKHYHPDIVYIDGAYLIRTSTKGGQRWERTLQVLESLKKVALSENIPIYITFQFSRSAPGTLEGISYTDGVSQLSSIVISLESEGAVDAGMAQPVQFRILKLLKGREGETGKIRISMDFDRMNFTQDNILAGMSSDFEYEDRENDLHRNTEIDNQPVAFI